MRTFCEKPNFVDRYLRSFQRRNFLKSLLNKFLPLEAKIIFSFWYNFFPNTSKCLYFNFYAILILQGNFICEKERTSKTFDQILFQSDAFQLYFIFHFHPFLLRPTLSSKAPTALKEVVTPLLRGKKTFIT